jgi:hypothetical protein
VPEDGLLDGAPHDELIDQHGLLASHAVGSADDLLHERGVQDGVHQEDVGHVGEIQSVRAVPRKLRGERGEGSSLGEEQDADVGHELKPPQVLHFVLAVEGHELDFCKRGRQK